MKADIRAGMLAVLMFSAACFLTGCAKGNAFSWAHSPGSNSDTEALASDAYAALINKDYAKALEYYSRILASDPDNARAIYGFSSASLADAGLDIGSLIANLVQNNAGAPSRLSPAVASIARAPGGSNILPRSIIDNIAKIRTAINDVLAEGKLPGIVKGHSDGTIAHDNPDVNLNMAFCYILRAAIRVQDSGLIEFDTDYKATIISSSPDLENLVNESLKDIARAYHRMLVVIEELNLSEDSQIASIKDDIHTLFDSLKSKAYTEYGITSNVDIDLDYL